MATQPTHTAISSTLLLLACIGCTNSTTTEEGPPSLFRFQAESTGDSLQLAVVPDEAATYRIEFEPSERESVAAQWTIVGTVRGFYTIYNQLTGEDLVLGVVDDGVFNRVEMQAREETSAQRWDLVTVGDGMCQFHTELLGETMVLTATTPGAANSVEIQQLIADSASQRWNLDQLGFNPAPCGD